MDFKEFKSNTLKLTSKRNSTFINSYGLRDAYRWSRKTFKLTITEKQYSYIIKTINNYLQDSLISSNSIMLPCNMGTINIRKDSTSIKIKDGKLKSTMTVDWNKTLKLWYSDEEAKQDKTIVKHEVEEVFKILYNKVGAFYKNSKYILYKPSKELRVKLKNIIQTGAYDAPLKFNKYGVCKFKNNS